MKSGAQNTGFPVTMTLDISNSIIQNFTKASNCLIVLPPNPNGDILSAGLALKSFLRKVDKETTLLSPGQIDERFSFLQGFDQIVSTLTITKNFIIEVSTKQAPLDELSYNKEESRLLIYLKPKSGELKESDVSIKSATFPYDLIITIGLSNLDHLGDFYKNNAELFFQTPVVNVDYKSSNESFGQINLVDLNSTSCSEIVMDLINQYEASLMDEHIATALLAGIISETNSFQHTRTTPQTFLKASQLISNGAKQQDIVTELYRSKSINFLKLWGRALARIKQDSPAGLVYTTISQSDLLKSSASDADVEQIIPEMAAQLKMAKILVVFVEREASRTEVICSLPPTINHNLLFGSFQPKIIAPQTSRFMVNTNLSGAETDIITLIKTEIGRLAA